MLYTLFGGDHKIYYNLLLACPSFVTYWIILRSSVRVWFVFCFFQAEDGIRDIGVTGVQTCALPICRVGQRSDGLEQLDDRAGPAVRHDQRQRVLVRRPDVDEVDVHAVDLGGELRQRVESLLALAPVVVGRPVASELLQRLELDTLRAIFDELLGGPARRGDASAEVVEILFRNVGAEGSDRDPFPNWIGHAGLLSVDCVSIYANDAMVEGGSVEGGAHGVRVTPSLRLAQRSEPRAELLGEQLGLFPGREVAALVDLVEVDQIGVGLLGPTPRGLICLVGEDARGHRDGDALGVPEATLVFPIESRRRDPCVRKPVKRDVVEDVVTRQFARVT